MKRVNSEELKKFHSTTEKTKKLKSTFHQLEKALSDIPIEDFGPHSGGYMFSLLQKAGVSYKPFDSIPSRSFLNSFMFSKCASSF